MTHFQQPTARFMTSFVSTYHRVRSPKYHDYLHVMLVFTCCLKEADQLLINAQSPNKGEGGRFPVPSNRAFPFCVEQSLYHIGTHINMYIAPYLWISKRNGLIKR